MSELFAAGARIDRYTVVRHVATGGMGAVWEAQLDGKHGFAKKVAIKTIRPELAGEDRYRQMFLEEARLSSRLSHANVAQVLDVGDLEGTIYIVFEWVEGRSLEATCADERARGSALSVERALRVLADTCAGLHAVHELTNDLGDPLGVVHRDVTPHNVLVSPAGFAKIIDFGLAKAKDRVIEATRSGVVKGTPQFMAPEQALGRAVDRRADVFSAGAVLFRALSGHAPFPNPDALRKFVLDAQVPRLPEGVPDAVRALVEKAMQRDPADRFVTAAAMRSAIERVLHGGGDLGAVTVRDESGSGSLVTVVEGEAVVLPRDGERSVAVAGLPPAKSSATRGLLLALVVAAAVVVVAIALALRS